METAYASGERSSLEGLQNDLKFIQSIEYIEKLLNSFPYIGAILNENRQVIFANDFLLETIGVKTVNDVLGKRTGEILKCVNAEKEIGGCGTSESCSVCGAVNCILEAQRDLTQVVSECRITSSGSEGLKAYDFKVTTTPFEWKDKTYLIFSLIDNSSEKRRLAMEKIFFHDVINKTGSMHGFISLLKEEQDIHKVHSFIKFLESINNDLTVDIKGQRDLLAAEKGELTITSTPQNSIDIIRMSAEQIRYHNVAHEKNINESTGSESFAITTDGALLRRILMNMLKNALEATPTYGVVEIGCKMEEEDYKFWVSNKNVIPRENQLQIFQRSFSTKGNGRGLGTYSMKLLGEQYLKGKVNFVSNKEQGTIFYISFPKTI